jgi:hypothetical protein
MLRRPARTTSALAISLAAALLAGGCESNMAQAPPPVWRLDGSATRYEPEKAQAGGEWTAHRTYEYRGGRDPKTGRADIQM